MKYFNKTRTIEQKVTDRETLQLLQRQSELLEEIREICSSEIFLVGSKYFFFNAKTFV